MRLTRGALAAATVAVSASAIGLPLFFTDWMPQSSDATQVRMVSAAGISRNKAEAPQLPVTDPGPQASAPPCYSYGGPYCGWVREYRGGCDKEWGLSYGIKDPDWICRHDPRPSPSATRSSSASPSPTETSSPSGGSGSATGGGGSSTGGSGSSTGGSGSSAGLSRLAEPHRLAGPKHSAAPSPTAASSPLGHPHKQQVLMTGPAGRPAATSSSGGAHSSVAVKPQVLLSEEDLPGSRPDLPTGIGRPVPDGDSQADYTASLLQAAHTAAENYVVAFPTATWAAGRNCTDAAPSRHGRSGRLPGGRQFVTCYD